jgi:predicted ATPase/DNA-binding CsgD family transcriptional regulator
MEKDSAPNNIAPAGLLSAREREVAELVVHGKSNRAIADALFLSERTVESHVSSIFNKLNVHSRVELAGAVLQGAAKVGSDTHRHHITSNNLPIQPTSFLGREHDVEEVKSLVGQHNLVTLSGAGGVGKTRLALQVGAELLDGYPDGVWFADLAPISDPELVSSVVAKVLGISQQEDRRVDESIPRWLKSKQLLLILDNCEHLIEASASTGDAIMRNCSKVRMLTTSRQALGINGEVVYRLPSLATPDRVAGLQVTEALQYAAIALFVDRAKAADNRFALTDETVPLVADICRRLDGIPLAIELAATRVKVLSMPSLAQRLNDRFRILTGGSRTALPRQKTLGALIDWSYDLLNPQEQTLLNRAGVFSGGFTLDAAMAVCAGDGIEATDILDLLSSLTDKSLVIADTSGGRERYHLLDSIRAYAMEKLAVGRESEGLARRHAEYFRDIAQRADEAFGAMSTATWLARVEPEIDNFRAAIDWATGLGDDIALGGAIVAALSGLWREGGLAAEGRRRITLAMKALDESKYPRIAAELWMALAWLSSGKSGYNAADHARTLYEEVNDARRAARALRKVGFHLAQMGRLEEAADAIGRALAASQEYGDKTAVVNCLSAHAMISAALGDFDGGRDSYAKVLAAYRTLDDEHGVAYVMHNLAALEFADGNVGQSVRHANEAAQILSRVRSSALKAALYNNITAYCIAVGDLSEAYAAVRQALHWAQGEQDSLRVAIAVQHLALLTALRGNRQRAAILMGYVDTKYKELGMEREPVEAWGHDKLMAALREHLSDAELETLAAEGAVRSEEQAVEEALMV